MSQRLAAQCVEALSALAASDPRITMIDGDLADSYGAIAFAEQWPERFIMAGIAEQNMVSMAAGMAACGARPWVFSFAAFLAFRAADQIRVSLSLTGMDVALVGSHAGGCGGRNGKTHQSIGDLAVIGAMPQVAVWTPCDPADAAHAVHAIQCTGGPSYLRTPRDGCSALPGKPGPLRWLTPEAPDLVVCAGLSAHWAMEVREALASQGREVAVLHVARFAPLPPGLCEHIARARRWYVIEDHVRHGGLSDAVARRAGRQPDAWFGWPADWAGGSGSSLALRQSCGLDAQSICAALQRRSHVDIW